MSFFSQQGYITKQKKLSFITTHLLKPYHSVMKRKEKALKYTIRCSLTQKKPPPHVLRRFINPSLTCSPMQKRDKNTQYPNTPSHHVCIPRSRKSRTSTSTPPLNHTQSHNPVVEKTQQGKTPAQQSLHSKTTPRIPPSLAQFNSSQLQFNEPL